MVHGTGESLVGRPDLVLRGREDFPEGVTSVLGYKG